MRLIRKTKGGLKDALGYVYVIIINMKNIDESISEIRSFFMSYLFDAWYWPIRIKVIVLIFCTYQKFVTLQSPKLES